MMQLGKRLQKNNNIEIIVNKLHKLENFVAPLNKHLIKTGSINMKRSNVATDEVRIYVP